MAISTNNGLTHRQAAQFFAAPESPLLRQYEALRAYFVEQLPSTEVAQRFGYSPGSFRVLCHQFRHDADYRDRFIQSARSGPQHAPARDQVRELVIAMRKRYLSVYDIQRELAAAGHTISIHSLTILLREEGFAACHADAMTNGPPPFASNPPPAPMSALWTFSRVPFAHASADSSSSSP